MDNVNVRIYRPKISTKNDNSIMTYLHGGGKNFIENSFQLLKF